MHLRSSSSLCWTPQAHRFDCYLGSRRPFSCQKSHLAAVMEAAQLTGRDSQPPAGTLVAMSLIKTKRFFFSVKFNNLKVPFDDTNNLTIEMSPRCACRLEFEPPCLYCMTLGRAGYKLRCCRELQGCVSSFSGHVLSGGVFPSYVLRHVVRCFCRRFS